jgi:hypothetical protein
MVIAALCGLALAIPGGAEASPLDGNGMWIWYVSESGGSAAAIARKANRHHLDTVLVKSSDGSSSWSQFTPGLVAGLHSRGLRVCAWQFVYGIHPVREAKVGAAAVDKGADCLVIDAESSYEGRYAAADRYVRVVRRLIGGRFPLALAGFPYVDFHPAFPYSVFLGRGGAKLNVPQMYWRAIGTSVRHVYSHTYRWNRPYDRHVLPLGQTYQNPPRDQIMQFRRLAAAHGARGVSWWSWQETGGDEWRWVGRRSIGHPGDPPPERWPGMKVGKAGDVVVVLQELLRDAGQNPEIDGSFGSRTKRAVERFQRDHGLEPTGTVRRATWVALEPYQPVRHRWWHPKASTKVARATAPDSARLPAVRDEIPPPGVRR